MKKWKSKEKERPITIYGKVGIGISTIMQQSDISCSNLTSVLATMCNKILFVGCGLHQNAA